MNAWSRAHSKFFQAGQDARGVSARGFLWTAIVGLIFGLIGFGQPLEDSMRAMRNKLHPDKASGKIVLVAVDEKSLSELGSWPWPRRHHAKMLDELSRLGAKQVFFDIVFSSPTTKADDAALEAALARSKARVVLPLAVVADNSREHEASLLPIPAFRKHADLASISFHWNYQKAVWTLPFAKVTSGQSFPSFATAMAGASTGPEGGFTVDYSLSPADIPTVSAIDLINGRIPPAAIAGKTMIVGTTPVQLGDAYFLPGHDLMGGVYVHLLGAETLLRGKPVNVGWLPPFLLALVAAAAALQFTRITHATAALVALTLLTLLVPILLEAGLIFVDIVPAFFVLAFSTSSLAWAGVRQRATLNSISGLPNLNALRQVKTGCDRPMVAARVRNFAEIASALPLGDERVLVEQIAKRLTVGNAGRVVFQGDDGLFLWLESDCAEHAIGEHLEALHRLFRSPVIVAGAPLDLAISFGVDVGSDRSLTNRLGSALVAADEAATEGIKWKLYDPAKLKDAAWRLSLLGQLDTAIDAGELWVAYQAKLDLRSGRICGAEALVRWNHPTKGLLGPLEFVPAAEQHDRIERLTTFVLDQSIAAAAAIGRRGMDFTIAVNLSARLLDHPDLAGIVSGLLSRHGLSPRRLILEVTETAALTRGDQGAALLEQLRASGVQISIDDFGTGQSTLEYLRRIPANEIKIDQSFVQAMAMSKSDRLLVYSTIQLAHSLGHKVVAEGVEDEQTLASLRELGCDLAQGFCVGRPAPLASFLRQLLVSEREQAAA